MNNEQQAAPAGERGARSRVTLSGPSPPRHHENHVLASLPQSELSLLAPHLHVVALTPGTVLQHQDLPLDCAFFPHEGLLSLLMITPNGATIETASTGRGGAMCPILQSDWGDGLLSVIAQGPVHASRVAAARLQAILPQTEALSRALSGCREALLLQLRQNVACSGLHSVEQRLPRWLLEAADRIESDLIPVTQEEVAQRLGVRRTTVTLMASKLQEVHAVRWGRSRVQILDRPRLEAEACTCYPALRERVRSLLPLDLPLPEKGFGT